MGDDRKDFREDRGEWYFMSENEGGLCFVSIIGVGRSKSMLDLTRYFFITLQF